MNKEVLNKLRDPKFYLENFCKVKSKVGGLVPFVLREAQKDLFNTIKRHNRVIVLKARQIGFSAAVTGYFYHATIMNPGVTTALIGYNMPMVTELLDKVKTFYKTTPPEMRPTMKYNSKYEMSFPKLDSKVMVLPSTENVGSGYTLNFCLSGNTNIMCPNGIVKNIKEVVAGDFILNGSGGPSKVKRVSKIKNDKRLIKINIYGTEDLILTEDHKVLVRGDVNNKHKGIWKEAKDIAEKDYIAYPYFQCRDRHKTIKFGQTNNKWRKPVNNVIDINFGLGEFIGWYLAEGTCSYGRISLSVNKNEVEYVMGVISRSIIKNVTSVGVCHSRKSQTAVIRINGVDFANFIGNKFGYRCDDKYINDDIWYWGWQFAYGMVKGMFLGDGSLRVKNKAVFTSVNGKLIYQLKKILVSLRIGLASVYYKNNVSRYGKASRPRYDLALHGKGNYKLRRKFGFELPVYNSKSAIYRTQHFPTINQGFGFWRRGKFHYWARIKKIETAPHEEYVYDISMERPPYSFLTTSGVVHNCLATELPKWDKADEKMASLLPAIPSTGKLVIESSPKGVGNLFHRMWVTDNEYVKKEYGWQWGYSREEIERIKLEINDPQIFAQEYDLTFLASGACVFEQELLDKCRKTILKLGDMVEDDGKKYSVEMEDDWLIYRRPNPNHFYCLGADVGEGLAGGDYSVGIIWDRNTGEEVALFRKKVPPDVFAIILNKMGRRYNNALMVPEVNSPGLAVVMALKQLVYPSPYFRLDKLDTMSAAFTDKLGWRTTSSNKDTLIIEFAKALRDKTLTIHSKILFDEMVVYVRDKNGNMNAQEGFNDDTVMAAAIGFQGFKVLYSEKLEQIDYRAYMPKSFAY
jgi:intein/homing endonuclease